MVQQKDKRIVHWKLYGSISNGPTWDILAAMSNLCENAYQ